MVEAGLASLLALSSSTGIVVHKPAYVPRLVESYALNLPVWSFKKISNRGLKKKNLLTRSVSSMWPTWGKLSPKKNPNWLFFCKIIHQQIPLCSAPVCNVIIPFTLSHTQIHSLIHTHTTTHTRTDFQKYFFPAVSRAFKYHICNYVHCIWLILSILYFLNRCKLRKCFFSNTSHWVSLLIWNLIPMIKTFLTFCHKKCCWCVLLCFITSP